MFSGLQFDFIDLTIGVLAYLFFFLILYIVYLVLSGFSSLISNALNYQKLLSESIEVQTEEIAHLSQTIYQKPEITSTLQILTLQNNLLQTQKLPKHYFGIYTRIIALVPVIYSIASILLEQLSV